jgi:hypothetical protein
MHCTIQSRLGIKGRFRNTLTNPFRQVFTGDSGILLMLCGREPPTGADFFRDRAADLVQSLMLRSGRILHDAAGWVDGAGLHSMDL